MGNNEDPSRVCAVCHGPVTVKNLSGICSRNTTCAREAKKIANARQHLARRGRDTDAPDAYLLEEDGIIDGIAVWTAVIGERKVRLTLREREQVIEIMLIGNCGLEEIGAHLAVTCKLLRTMLGAMGYEVIRDPHVSAARINLITRKDRPGHTLAPEIRSIKP